ncbi:hypothetical protein N7478_009331 [Penicillium angulare]|uniref:uncharacterized protein n=1 Tax=Penicillium angulare TaxID=116970 RepID=UPI00253FCC1B|nr:uncharacterized protein N7478_009331 [Penicillium angulare]KAJ5266523.1 hypothetical protein N7478_009331 [Penicillium angulare]
MIPVTEQGPDSSFMNGVGNNSEALGISAVIFMSIALYNALELMILIPLNFKRYRSLYFWALITSTVLGVIPDCLGSAFQFFNLTPLWLSILLSNIGFVFMVPNQSVVLYSRLHLVSQNTSRLVIVRWLIIISTPLIVSPTIITNCGASLLPQNKSWSHGFDVIEKLQITWFTFQEMFISSVYIWDTVRIIRLGFDGDNSKRRHKILYELLAVNVVAIIMDIALLVLEYLGYYFAQVLFKASVYSIKLKLEFAVLGMLVSLVHTRAGSTATWQADLTSSTGFS